MIRWLREPVEIRRWLYFTYVFIMITAICQTLFGVPS